ncbi:MAG: pentapeptide repeat-containing protein [Deltaproteobacteria bacterium]|nr:pentapeptide repeat-containing protein [Deltaproteobacteria bacterium]
MSANLSSSQLISANLSSSQLISANLSSSQLISAHLSSTHLSSYQLISSHPLDITPVSVPVPLPSSSQILFSRRPKQAPPAFASNLQSPRRISSYRSRGDFRPKTKKAPRAPPFRGFREAVNSSSNRGRGAPPS